MERTKFIKPYEVILDKRDGTYSIVNLSTGQTVSNIKDRRDANQIARTLNDNVRAQVSPKPSPKVLTPTLKSRRIKI